MNFLLLHIYLIFELIFFNASCVADITIQHSTDSVEICLSNAKNSNLDLATRKDFLKEAYRLTLEEDIDSIRNKYLLKISFRYYVLRDSLNFRRVNKESTELSQKLNDSLNLAANLWDLGRFYSRNGIKDSAYYVYSRAQKLYQGLKNDNFEGRMLLEMAIMQSDVKDFTGSEITTIRAISKLKPLKEYGSLYRCYNNLAINFNNLEEYDDAISNHQIALEYQKQIKRKNTFKENTLNNIGVVYKNKGDYHNAIEYYRLALKTIDLKNTNIKLYATLIDNLAYSEFKIDDLSDTEERLYESLRIRDSINDYMGIAMNKLHLAEYFVHTKDSAKAKQYALEVSELSERTQNYRELFPSLLLLSKLDAKNSANYIDKYILINDSLKKQERTIRNKFARIQFQTDEFIVKNKRLSRQNESILIVSILTILFGVLLYIIRSQRVRNKNLLLEKEQQKANEDIYNLMIAQQNKLDEGSKIEKKRISEELHDGILGKLFGTRLILSNLNADSNADAVQKREKYINDLQEIEEEIRDISHELNNESNIANANIGYETLIETLLLDQSAITYFNFEFKNDKNILWKEKEGQLKMNLYRIIQEATQNINKYAQAKNVFVEFRIKNDQLILEIKDDGVGFNKLSKTNGIGLQNIKSRAEKFDGSVEIISDFNRGTSIKITIPNK